MNKVYVGNLPYNATQPDIEGLFNQFGEITEVAMIQDRVTNKFKGFAFVTYSDAQAAEKSLALNGQDFGGRPLKVSIARAMEKRSGGGGGRSGGGRSGGGRSGGGRSGGGRFGGERSGGGRGGW